MIVTQVVVTAGESRLIYREATSEEMELMRAIADESEFERNTEPSNADYEAALRELGVQT